MYVKSNKTPSKNIFNEFGLMIRNIMTKNIVVSSMVDAYNHITGKEEEDDSILSTFNSIINVLSANTKKE